MVTSAEATVLPGSKNERSSSTASGRETEVAEPVGQVDDGVMVEDHGVLSGRQLDRVPHGTRALGSLPPDGRGIDGRHVDRDLLGVPGAAPLPHHHREHLGARARLSDADAQRVDITHLLAARLGIAEGFRTHGLGSAMTAAAASARTRMRVRCGEA
jgi:hypothetical protein